MEGGNFVNQSFIVYNYVPKITQQAYQMEVELESPVRILKTATATVNQYVIQHFFFN